MRFIGVFNRDGGTFKTTDMETFSAEAEDIFREHGQMLTTRIVEGKNLVAELERAADEADVLIAGGGDGTISAAAGVAFHKGIPLGVLPAGTMNLFARSLGMPMNLEDALAVLADGEIKHIDIATANGRPFIHQYAVGVHAKLVKLRSAIEYKSRIGKMMASTRAAIGALLRPPVFRADLVMARGTERRMAAGISVSNDPLEEGHVPHAEHLDAGVLGIYVVKPLSPWVLLKLFFGVMRGRWKSAPEVIEREAKEVSISFPRRKKDAMAVIDGELIKLDNTVNLKIHPGALQIVMPKAPREDEMPTAAEALAEK